MWVRVPLELPKENVMDEIEGNQYSMKTIFDEEIEVGDMIMYTTVRHNDAVFSFATVIEYQDYTDNYFADPHRKRIKAHKFYEISSWRSGPEDRNVLLTNPNVVLCNTNIREKLMKMPGCEVKNG